jgi:hypothetical protein
MNSWPGLSGAPDEIAQHDARWEMASDLHFKTIGTSKPRSRNWKRASDGKDCDRHGSTTRIATADRGR